jgi:hypothetical protein
MRSVCLRAASLRRVVFTQHSVAISSRLHHLAYPQSFGRVNLSSAAAAEFLVKVPSMGDSITEGQVVEISKKIGDSVSVDEVVAVLETDKVSVDVTAQEAGTVVAIDVNPGDVVQINSTILRLGPAGSAPSASAPKAAPAAAKAASSSSKSFTPQPPTPKQKEPELPKYQPSIQFKYGKRPAAKGGDKKSSSKSASHHSKKSSSHDLPPPAVYGGDEIPVAYKPKPLSEKEIEAINVILRCSHRFLIRFFRLEVQTCDGSSKSGSSSICN